MRMKFGRIPMKSESVVQVDAEGWDPGSPDIPI
jgi:hypothetical protein